MSSNGSFGDILQTVSVRECVMACLQLEDLSHMMIASPLLRTYCENSAAAKQKWQKAVDKLNRMNHCFVHDDDDDDDEDYLYDYRLKDEDPRFIFDEVTESFKYNTAFDGMSLQGKFNLLFRFQHLCIDNLLGCFDLGSYSMQGFVCQWSTWRCAYLSYRHIRAP